MDAEGAKVPMDSVEAGEWRRAGRGRILTFFATNDEVQAWLLDSLPREFSPDQLISWSIVALGSEFIHKAEILELDEFRDSLERSDLVHHYFIWSPGITPRLFMDDRWIDRVCALAGLPLLQHGTPIQGIQSGSALVQTDSVKNERTGEVLTHSDYRLVYTALSRRIRKSLVYSTVGRFPDGTEYENSVSELMTRAAAQQSRAGNPFVKAPGRLVK